ncbi:unnamed protein product [Vitrella brassicaformis CCMP3155]|uniref:Transmembrane protein n=1 Tax=Vitrella brassicaformis (strain CCMP3155) TaxID=1169540 RepID=A0A0G4ES63_VITBC|nr:unnamed protein product [Vitrella brassicaformis CCMP3155]|eukprot:CEM00471.1 unnamed protein product [Vitrella brassicaformis CCMP3155]
MSVNVLKIVRRGGGPAPLVNNPGKGHCWMQVGLNALITAVSGLGIVAAQWENANCGEEATRYLITMGIMALFSAAFFILLGTQAASDTEWSCYLMVMIAIGIVEGVGGAWGVWICYRVYSRRHFKGTREHNCWTSPKTLYYVIQTMCLVHIFTTVYAIYITHISFLVELIRQMGSLKEVR